MSITEHHLSNRPVIDLYNSLEPTNLALFLEDRLQPRAARTLELLASHKRFCEVTAGGIKTKDIAKRAADLSKMLRLEVKEIDETRGGIKEPVLHAGRQIDGAARALTDPLMAALKEVDRRLTEWLKAVEVERRRAAEAEAAAAEAEMQRLMIEADQTGDANVEDAAIEALGKMQDAEALASSTTELTRLQSDTGVVTALRDNWVYGGVSDFEKVPRDYLMVSEAAVKSAIKNGVRAIPGLIIQNDKRLGALR